MVTLNQLLIHSIYRTTKEANQMTFKNKEEREKWEEARSNEIYLELKKKYCSKAPPTNAHQRGKTGLPIAQKP